MKRWFPAPLASVLLALLWLVLNGSLASGQLVLAGLIGLALPVLASAWEWRGEAPVADRRPAAVRAGASGRQIALAARLGGRLLVDIVVANLVVARKILFSREAALHPALISIPLRLDSPTAVAALAGIVTLTPGTLSADIEEPAGKRGFVLVVHALDAPDPQALAEEVRERYEELLLEMIR